MNKKSGTSKDAADKLVKGIRRKTCKQYSAEEKIRIVLAGLRGEESIAALCRREGISESLLRLVGLDWAVPDFSTLCRRQRTLNVSLPYRGSTGPLNLLIDSTGIKAEGEGEWNARKHGGPNAASGARFT